MKFDDNTRDQLAAAYVLGTMTGQARSRFEHYMRAERDVREAVWRWERELNQQVESVRPLNPPVSVWDRIDKATTRHEPQSRESWLWRALSGVLAGMLVVAMATQWTTEAPLDDKMAAELQLALIEDEQDQPLWLISVDNVTGRLRTRAVNVPARELDQAFELWMLVDGTPRSLGLLPVTTEPDERDLSPALMALLNRSSGLAVSLEPATGSTTGLPTGPVLFQAPVLEL